MADFKLRKLVAIIVFQESLPSLEIKPESICASDLHFLLLPSTIEKKKSS